MQRFHLDLENLLSLSAINKIAISIVFLLCGFLMAYFLIVPQYDELKSLLLQTGKKQAELEGKSDYYAQVADLYKKIQNYKEAIDKINNTLPKKSSLGELVYFFQKKSVENGLLLKKLSVEKGASVSAGKTLVDVGFSMNSMGTYTSFKNFLYSMEKSVKLVEVPSLSFSSPTSSDKTLVGQDPQFDFTFKASAYSY